MPNVLSKPCWYIDKEQDTTGLPLIWLRNPDDINLKHLVCCRDRCGNILDNPFSLRCGGFACKPCKDMREDLCRHCYADEFDAEECVGEAPEDLEEPENLEEPDDLEEYRIDPTDAREARAKREAVDRLQAVCPFGCGATKYLVEDLTLKNIEAHKLQCDLRVISCTRCSEEMTFDRMPEHRAECRRMIRSDTSDIPVCCRTMLSDFVEAYLYLVLGTCGSLLCSQIHLFSSVRLAFKENLMPYEVMDNGKFIWKIAQVQAKRNEAQSRHSVYSLPFYTERFGFKISARLYFEGTEYGRGTHISLSLVRLEGRNDPALNSYTKKLTVKLINQKKLRNMPDIVEKFGPELTALPCMKPLFCDQDIVFGPEHGYVVGDVMYIVITEQDAAVSEYNAPTKVDGGASSDEESDKSDLTEEPLPEEAVGGGLSVEETGRTA